jgi:two-component system, LytTR family, sensor kinase
MKKTCQGCGISLAPDGDAYICSYECTFCQNCFLKNRRMCPNCAGELTRRPKRLKVSPDRESAPAKDLADSPRLPLVILVSFCVWLLVALAGTVTIWQLYRSTDMPMPFRMTLGLELSQILTYAPLTPFVFILATRYPIRRENWPRRILLYLGAGVAFCIAHIALRGITPYAIYEPKYRDWISAIWNPHLQQFAVQWDALRKLFLHNLVDDITGTFIPIVLVAHAVSYYRKYRDREIRTSHLQAQLAKAHLHSLKSQLQPHFLFNTMHSISALMLTDVKAADRMITRLADLLRMNLESAGTQITTLSRELDFVNCYLSIEQIRFEERLHITFDIDPETLDAQVPMLLLQPLVDNAVKHGISHLIEGGEIRISAARQNGDLKLEVRDNGPGLSASSSDRGCRLGLKVTRERLEALYGQNQCVEVASPPEGGVSVLVSIPFQNASEAVFEESSAEPLSLAEMERLNVS